MDRVERWLCDGYTPRRASARAQTAEPDGLGLKRDTADRYVAAALLRLKLDGERETIESKRARYVGMLHANIDRAVRLTRTYERDGEQHEYAAPDLRAVNQAIALLAEIEGVRATKAS